jgi:hypothetical protein
MKILFMSRKLNTEESIKKREKEKKKQEKGNIREGEVGFESWLRSFGLHSVCSPDLQMNTAK